MHTWYVIDVDNINIAEYFDKKDYNIFECKESFFKINNLQFFDRILSASEIELKISENNNLSEIQKCIRIIIKKIYQYNDKFNVYRPNEHYFPKSEYFSSFFKNMNKFKYFDEKNQLYMIILFYLSLADYLNILQEKKILYSIIKDIIELIKIKEKNDIKNSKYICDSIIIKDFDIFLEMNNINRATLNKLNETRLLIIIILFYGHLMITKYNWCFIFIDKNFDLDKYLYKDFGVNKENSEINQNFFDVQEKNHDIDCMYLISAKYMCSENIINNRNKKIEKRKNENEKTKEKKGEMEEGKKNGRNGRRNGKKRR